MNIATIVLSAGKGTRMNSDIPKVLHKVLGKEIILWSKDSVKNFKNKFFVIGHKHELVNKYIAGDAEVVIQEEQLGTGHALSVVFSDKKFLSQEERDILVQSWDNLGKILMFELIQTAVCWADAENLNKF